MSEPHESNRTAAHGVLSPRTPVDVLFNAVSRLDGDEGKLRLLASRTVVIDCACCRRELESEFCAHCGKPASEFTARLLRQLREQRTGDHVLRSGDPFPRCCPANYVEISEIEYIRRTWKDWLIGCCEVVRSVEGKCLVEYCDLTPLHLQVLSETGSGIHNELYGHACCCGRLAVAGASHCGLCGRKLVLATTADVTPFGKQLDGEIAADRAIRKKHVRGLWSRTFGTTCRIRISVDIG